MELAEVLMRNGSNTERGSAGTVDTQRLQYLGFNHRRHLRNQGFILEPGNGPRLSVSHWRTVAEVAGGSPREQGCMAAAFATAQA